MFPAQAVLAKKLHNASRAYSVLKQSSPRFYRGCGTARGVHTTVLVHICVTHAEHIPSHSIEQMHPLVIATPTCRGKQSQLIKQLQTLPSVTHAGRDDNSVKKPSPKTAGFFRCASLAEPAAEELQRELVSCYGWGVGF